MSSVRPSTLTPPSTPRVAGKRKREIRPIVANAIADLAPKKRGVPKKRVVSPITPMTGKRKREPESTVASTASAITSLAGTILQPFYVLGSYLFPGSNPTPTLSRVADLLQSPAVKIARWEAKRTPGGGVRVTPKGDQKSKLRTVDNALYVIKQKDDDGKVTGVYAGSVAKSGPDAKRKNSVHKRFKGYNQEVKNPKKNRKVLQALRAGPCDITVYRTVEGDESDLHDAEASLIDYVSKKHPDAKPLNVSDPRKEPHRTGKKRKTSAT